MSIDCDFELLCYFVDVDIVVNYMITTVYQEIAAKSPEVF